MRVVLLLTGLVILARVIIGPFKFLLNVNSPLTAESIFGLAFTLLLIFKSDDVPNCKVLPSRAPNLAILLLLLMVAACFWTSLSFPFLFDEYVLIRQGRSFQPATIIYTLTHGGGDGFFRPLGYISFGLDSLWAGTSALGWHVLGLLLHIANCLLIYLFTLRVYTDAGTALWAAALFGIHGSRPESVIYAAMRFDLLATFFLMGGLLLFIRYNKTPNPWLLILSLMAMTAALLSKESAYVFPLLLLLIPRVRMRATIPFFALTLLIFAYRWHLVGGIGGYKDPSGVPDILHFRFIALVKALALRLWAVLYFPINWSVKPEPYLALALALGMAAMAYLGWAASPARPRVVLPLGFTLIASIPVAHMLLIRQDLLGSAHVYLPSVGASLLLATAITAVPRGRIRLAVGAALLLFHFAALHHNLKIWGTTAVLAKRTCESAAQRLGDSASKLVFVGLPRSINGVFFFANGFPECLEMHSRFPLASIRAGNLESLERSDPNTKYFLWDASRSEIVPDRDFSDTTSP